MSNLVMIGDELLTSYVDFVKNDNKIMYPITTIDAVYDSNGVGLKQYLVNYYQPKGTYALSNHNHDSVYAKTNHTHDYAPTVHSHDDRYFTESEINTKLNAKANTSHTHDDRYFTESEINNRLQFGITDSIKPFTVGGDANTYYPVVFTFNNRHRYVGGLFRLGRNFADVAPDTWNTPTHRGGVTLDLLISGDHGWGGNSKDIILLHYDETYTNIIADVTLSTSGLIVYLRGGGAAYYASYDFGRPEIIVNIGTYTASDKRQYPPRTSVVKDWHRKYYIQNVYKSTPAELGAAAASHTHDDRYYTESEMNTKLNGKSNTNHTHSSFGNISISGILNFATKNTDYFNIHFDGSTDSDTHLYFDAGDDHTPAVVFRTRDFYAEKTIETLRITNNGIEMAAGKRYYQQGTVGNLSAVQSGSPNGNMLWAW